MPSPRPGDAGRRACRPPLRCHHVDLGLGRSATSIVVPARRRALDVAAGEHDEAAPSRARVRGLREAPASVGTVRLAVPAAPSRTAVASTIRTRSTAPLSRRDVERTVGVVRGRRPRADRAPEPGAVSDPHLGDSFGARRGFGDHDPTGHRVDGRRDGKSPVFATASVGPRSNHEYGRVAALAGRRRRCGWVLQVRDPHLVGRHPREGRVPGPAEEDGEGRPRRIEPRPVPQPRRAPLRARVTQLLGLQCSGRRRSRSPARPRPSARRRGRAPVRD